MPQPDPDLILIRTALRMSQHLAQVYHGDLTHFYDCQIEAIAACGRLEGKLNGKGKLAQFTSLTEAEVLAMECPTGT